MRAITIALITVAGLSFIGSVEAAEIDLDAALAEVTAAPDTTAAPVRRSTSAQRPVVRRSATRVAYPAAQAHADAAVTDIESSITEAEAHGRVRRAQADRVVSAAEEAEAMADAAAARARRAQAEARFEGARSEFHSGCSDAAATQYRTHLRRVTRASGGRVPVR